MPKTQNFRAAWGAFRHPVRPEARRTVREAWERLDPRWRVPRQLIGRQAEGCGATIGVMPRCDFGCTGCYLGREANRTPPLALADVKAQMRLLRERLGVWGNLQITDGEVLLRPVDEVLELLDYAREVELVPMVMTHGDHFRRTPGLLERLMVEGGLVELSLHIDTTQRGRIGPEYANATREETLNPLRDEFAGIVRAARRTTGLPLRVASTATVMPSNLEGVPAIVRWFVANADVFRIISFQPAAQVGRTRSGSGGGVTVEALWRKVAEGLHGSGEAFEHLEGKQWWFGHPECSVFVNGVVATQPQRPNRLELIGIDGEVEIERRFFEHVLRRWGGISFRAGSRLEHLGRLAGIVCRSPGFAAVTVPRLLWSLMRRLDPQRPRRLAWRLLRGRAKLHPLSIGSHHFMSAEEIRSDRGQERLANCIFTTPIDGRLVSMCEVNALGARASLYDRMREASNDPAHDEPVELTVGVS